MNALRIPFVDLAAHNKYLEQLLTARLKEVIASGQLILGEQVERFERRFAAYVGARHAVAVNSGTDALILALRALELTPDDEVITVPNSFIATVSSIILAGARPRFVDVAQDLNMDPERLTEAVTDRTRVVLPVHLTGRPAAMGPIMDFARRRGLSVVEDAAQAIGATWHGKMAGTFGRIGCFSLHPLKILGAVGDAGILVTDDKELAARLVLLRNFGLHGRDTVMLWAGNSRLDSLQAAFLDVKMDFLDNWLRRRREIADYYTMQLADVVTTPAVGEGLRSSFQTYVIQAEERDALVTHLAKQGIETRIHYPTPLHLQPAAKDLGYDTGDFPTAERLASRILSLPIYTELTRTQQDHVIRSIRGFYGKSALY